MTSWKGERQVFAEANQFVVRVLHCNSNLLPENRNMCRTKHVQIRDVSPALPVNNAPRAAVDSAIERLDEKSIRA